MDSNVINDDTEAIWQNNTGLIILYIHFTFL